MKQTQQMSRQSGSHVSGPSVEEQPLREAVEVEFAEDEEQPWLYHSR